MNKTISDELVAWADHIERKIFIIFYIPKVKQNPPVFSFKRAPTQNHTGCDEPQFL